MKLPKKGDLGVCNNWRGIMLNGSEEDQGKTDVEWTLATQLHDLDYVDDIQLLSQKLQHILASQNQQPELIAEKSSLRVFKKGENQSDTS